MLNAVAKPLVKLVERYLPDPYIFVLLLSLRLMSYQWNKTWTSWQKFHLRQCRCKW